MVYKVNKLTISATTCFIFYLLYELRYLDVDTDDNHIIYLQEFIKSKINVDGTYGKLTDDDINYILTVLSFSNYPVQIHNLYFSNTHLSNNLIIQIYNFFKQKFILCPIIEVGSNDACVNVIDLIKTTTKNFEQMIEPYTHVPIFINRNDNKKISVNIQKYIYSNVTSLQPTLLLSSDNNTQNNIKLLTFKLAICYNENKNIYYIVTKYLNKYYKYNYYDKNNNQYKEINIKKKEVNIKNECVLIIYSK